MLPLKKYCFLVLIGFFSWPYALLAQPLTPAEHQTFAEEIDHAFLNQLLRRWYPLALDREKGGFLSTFTYDWKPTGAQDKMIVTQSRHTWLPSKAAQLYPNEAYLRESARQGFAFLRDKMWDRTYGGFYTWVTRDGQPKRANDLKTAYGNAFGIYALSTYYQTYGDTAALNLAQQAFYWLEKHSHDPAHKGYYQNLQRNGDLANADPDQRNTAAELHYKDQNSSIHLLEAFTELYSVWPNPLLRERLTEMLTLIRDTIVTDKGYLTLFLTPAWKPISYRDSTQEARKAHEYEDHVSFGHDVETAYLMLEASHALGLAHDTRTVAVAKKMVDHSLNNGWNPSMGGFYERGYYFKGQDKITILDDRKNWWAQAEGLNTLLLMAEDFPNDPMQYGSKFKLQWKYIQQNLMDSVHGGWYEWGIDKEPNSKMGLKGHVWKAAYHDGRSLMNCKQRLHPDTKAPSSPTELTLSHDKKILQWKPSQDDRYVLGYDIYLNNERLGYTPLVAFYLPTGKYQAGASIKVVARDVQGNESKASAVLY